MNNSKNPKLQKKENIATHPDNEILQNMKSAKNNKINKQNKKQVLIRE